MGQYGKVKMAIFRKGVPKWEEEDFQTNLRQR